MSWQRLLPPAIVLALGLAGIWLLYNLELVPQRVWTGFQGEAKRNPWYAAEQLIARMDGRVHAAKSVPALKALPAEGVLFLPRRLGAINRDEQLKLLQWVEAGGHLIVEAEAPRQPDPILDALGMNRKMVDTRRAARFAEAMFPGATTALKVEISQWRTLEAKDAAFALKGRDATWLVHAKRGAGRVTALTDLNFAGNMQIRHFDHAEFLWQLTQLSPRPGAVAFFHSPVKLSLAAWLLEHAWAVLAAAALLLAAWLARIVPRFGPVAPDPEPARRRLLDHLRASGRFQWAAGGGRELAEAARDAALRRVMRALPDFAALDADARAARLVAQFGLTPEGARRVLQAAPAAGTAADLLAAASVYQSIHEQLFQTRGRR
jgi:hypothetical protein